jgi:AraC-like DNA-binding protein
MPAVSSKRSTQLGFAIPSQYIRQIAEQMKSGGAPVDRWLAQHGLSESQLDAPVIELDRADFRQLILDAVRLSNEPALGLLVGERLVASTHGIVGYAALSSGTIREAIEIFERFTSLRTSLVAISHETHRTGVRIVFREGIPLEDIQRPILEAVILSIKNVLDAISMGACKIHEVAFPFSKPEYVSFASELFGCKVNYSQSWAGLSMPASALDLRLKLSDSGAFDQAARICQTELDKLAKNESLTARVQRLLLEKQNGFPSLQATARLLHMTPRTLHRRLVDENTSFREILEGVRHTLAVAHLKAGNFSIEEIAYVLGYSDLPNFRRAFKRWESVPPSEFQSRERS